MTFKELQEKVLEWANSHDLLHEENAGKQFMKFIEEVFEFRDEWTLYHNELDSLDLEQCVSDEIFDDSYLYELENNMQMEMGDIFVTLIILCKQLNIEPMKCLGMAYNKIKDRLGKTLNGTFVKAEDLEE